MENHPPVLPQLGLPQDESRYIFSLDMKVGPSRCCLGHDLTLEF
jgi:hypothetical protein